MAGNQYQHHRTFTEIEWDRRNSGYCGPIHKDDQTKGNNNKYIIGVVATTCHSRTNDLTTSKALSRAIK